jgi:hypothetical protein
VIVRNDEFPSTTHMHRTRLRTFISLVLALSAVACETPGAGGDGSYDPNARETLGRVISRKDTGMTTQQARSTTLIPVGGLFVPVPMDRGTGPLPVFEYQVKLEDGRTVSIFAWYPHHEVGNCVKVFESTRRDYPRFINSHGCKG